MSHIGLTKHMSMEYVHMYVTDSDVIISQASQIWLLRVLL